MQYSIRALFALGLLVSPACGDSPDTPPPSIDDAFVDVDGDGFGTVALSVALEPDGSLPAGFAWEGGDCDDHDAGVNPAAQEVCGGEDEDCDGLIDTDDDSYSDVTPTWYEDADGDGHGAPGTAIELCVAPEGFVGAGDDCDDTNTSVHPGAQEICGGLDDDCDGLIDDADDSVALDEPVIGYLDLDGDGFGVGLTSVCDASLVTPLAGDCDDDDPRRFPGAPERCNGLDDDCDRVDDTLGYWRFDEGEGASVASTGGLGLIGELVNATWVERGDDFALEFHGDGYVQFFPESLELLPEDGLTVSLFACPSSLRGTSWDSLLSLGSSYNAKDSYWLGYYGQRLGWAQATESALYVLYSAAALPEHVGRCQHVLASWSATEAPQLFINGEALTETDPISPEGPTSLVSFDGPLTIGVDANGGHPGNFYNGVIDEVKLFSCAVNARQARADYLTNWPFQDQ